MSINISLSGKHASYPRQIRANIRSPFRIDQCRNAKTVCRSISRNIPRQFNGQVTACEAIHISLKRQRCPPPICTRQTGQYDFRLDIPHNSWLFSLKMQLPISVDARSPIMQIRLKMLDKKPLIYISRTINTPRRRPDLFGHAGNMPSVQIAESHFPFAIPDGQPRFPATRYVATWTISGDLRL